MISEFYGKKFVNTLDRAVTKMSKLMALNTLIINDEKLKNPEKNKDKLKTRSKETSFEKKQTYAFLSDPQIESIAREQIQLKDAFLNSYRLKEGKESKISNQYLKTCKQLLAQIKDTIDNSSTNDGISGDGERDVISKVPEDVMKIGDVIYLQYSTHILYQGGSEEHTTSINWPGYLVGDGLSSERLHCMHKRNVDEYSISKFLFKVELANDNLLNNSNSNEVPGIKKNNEQIRREMIEEYEEHKKECEGSPVTYGQNIILRHLQSNTFIFLNNDELARQIGPMQICLKKEIEDFSNMTVLPSSRVREMGDFVRYSDSIYIANAKEDHYYLHASEFLSKHEVGLEINASETKTEWKPKLFRSFNQIGEGGPQTPRVCPGDIINIHSKHFGGFLSVKATSQEDSITNWQNQINDIKIKEISKMKIEQKKNKNGIITTNQLVQNENNMFSEILNQSPSNRGSRKQQEDQKQILLSNFEKQGNAAFNIVNDKIADLMNKVKVPVPQAYKNLITTGGDSESKMYPIGLPYCVYNKSLGYSYSLKMEIIEEPSLYGFWEVQNLDSFCSDIIRYDQRVRIKNIATQLYLSIDPEQPDKLVLSQDIKSKFCEFVFRTKIPVSKEGYLSCQDLIRMEDCNGRYVEIEKSVDYKEILRPWEFSGEGASLENQKEIQKTEDEAFLLKASSKHDRAEVNFELIKCEKSNIEVSNKLSSLFPNLVNFLVFLQSWGLKETEIPSSSMTSQQQPIEFNYDVVCEKEKDMHIEKAALLENLKNLIQFLEEGSSDSKQSFGVKAMLEQNNTLRYKDKQDYILHQHILEVLLNILQHLFLICFESLKTLKGDIDFEEDTGGVQSIKLMKFENIQTIQDSKLDRLPQTIARKQLDPIIKKIIEIVLLCSRNSETTSQFLIKYKEFFLKLLHFYPEHVPNLMLEMASNLGDFGNLSNNDNLIDSISDALGGIMGQKNTDEIEKVNALDKASIQTHLYHKNNDNIGYQVTRGSTQRNKKRQIWVKDKIPIEDPNYEKKTMFHNTWISQLEEVDSKKRNIDHQIFLFDMLSALIFNKKTGDTSKKYQQLIYNDIFNRVGNQSNQKEKVENASNFFSKGYLKFKLQKTKNDKFESFVIFCIIDKDKLDYFNDRNSFITNVGHDSIKSENKIDQLVVNLGKLSKKSSPKENPNYIRYISSYIRMMAVMCRTRFQEAINSCTASAIKNEGLGLTMEYCLETIKDENVDPEIKASLLDIYNTVYIDKHPLQRLSLYTNRCFSHGAIGKKKITSKAILWLNEGISETIDNSKYLIKQRVEDIHLFIDKLKQQAFNMSLINSKQASYIYHSVHGQLGILNFQAKVLELVYSFIDFGYAQIDMVISCTKLSTLVLTSEFYSDLESNNDNENKNALDLMRFYSKVRQNWKNLELYNAHRKVILNALKVLSLIGKYRTLLQLQVMLMFFKKFQNCRTEFYKNIPLILRIFPLYPMPEDKEDENEQKGCIASGLSLISGSSKKPKAKFNQQLMNSSIKHKKKDEKQRLAIIIGLFESIKINHRYDNSEGQNNEDKLQEDDIEDVQMFREIKKQILKLKFDIEIDDVLIDSLFKLKKNSFSGQNPSKSKLTASIRYCDTQDLNRRVEKELIGILVDFYNQKQTILQELMKVELVKGKIEINLFKSLLNITVTSQQIESSRLLSSQIDMNPKESLPYTFSIQELSNKVDKQIEYYQQSNKTFSQVFNYKDNDVIILAIIKKLNKMMRDMYQIKINFGKLQNLMRNLNYHRIFIKLFQLGNKQPIYYNILKNLVEFFQLYTQSNPSNQTVLMPFQKNFVDLVSLEFQMKDKTKQCLDSSQIVKNLYSCIADQGDQTLIIDYIFQKITSIVENSNMAKIFSPHSMRKDGDSNFKNIEIQLKRLICYKRMLSGLIFDNNLEMRKSNQRHIISNLINSKQLIKLFEFKYFRNLREMKDKNFTLIEFFNSYITLLAELSWNYKLGIKQSKRLITKEILLEILTSSNTHYLLKKHFLKCFHHIILDGELIGIEDKEELIEDVLNLVISNDLAVFGLYKLKKEEDECNLPPILIGNNKSSLKTKQMAQFNQDNLIVQNDLEYWHYINSDQSLEEREYGLLYFTYSFVEKCVLSVEKFGFGVDYAKFADSFQSIRSSLSQMLELVRPVEQNKVPSYINSTKFNINNTCYMISQCLTIIPDLPVQKIGSNLIIEKIDHHPAREFNDQVTQDGRADFFRDPKNNNKMDMAEGEETDINGRGHQYTNIEEEEDDEDVEKEKEENTHTSKDALIKRKKSNKSIASYIKKYLIRKRITYEEFIDLIVFKNTHDYVKLLASKLKRKDEQVLGNINMVLKMENSHFVDLEQSEVSISHLTRALIKFERQLMQSNSSGTEKKFSMNLQGLLKKLEGGTMHENTGGSSDQLQGIYYNFLKEFIRNQLLNQKYDQELNPWVQKMRNYITFENSKGTNNYFNTFLGLLLKSGQTYFLLRTLKQMLSYEMENIMIGLESQSSSLSTLDDSKLAIGRCGTSQNLKMKDQTYKMQKRTKKFTKIQKFYTNSQVPLLCLSMINCESKDNLVDESCKVISFMLKNGNIDVQKYILAIFKDKIYTKSFFFYLKDVFRSMTSQLISEIRYPLKQKPIIELSENMLIQKFTGNNPFKQITNVINMLKLLCDGCNTEFQDYLRTQKSDNNENFSPYSINVINEVSEFLVQFLNINRKNLKNDEDGKKIGNMMTTCLNLLFKASTGPCFENQALLIKNRRLFDFLNEILRFNIFNLQEYAHKNKEKILNDVKIRIFSEAIKVSKFLP